MVDMIYDPEKLPSTRYLFFTGKGGVGKTTIACATAVALAAMGKKILIVSTDPASNLDDVFKTEINNKPTPIPNTTGLYGINLDPEKAAQGYRESVVGPYRNLLPEAAVKQIEEQLSGACTVEIAAFDEFAKLLAEPAITKEFDHVIFDTAPTGHTLRLLELPKAWSGFLNENQSGVSCLGPLSGLGDKRDLYSKTVQELSNPMRTLLILVARPERIALAEAARASEELKEIGIRNHYLVINGILKTLTADSMATVFYNLQQKSLNEIPASLLEIPRFIVPLVPDELTGVDRLRTLFRKDATIDSTPSVTDVETTSLDSDFPRLQTLVDRLAQNQQGIVLTMGKGGVGKTTIAAAIAVGLAEKGLRVHLSTTDPAAHLSFALGKDSVKNNLTVSRIDPQAEIDTYRAEVLAQMKSTLDEEGLELVKEDLSSPCTEEIAVFRAFAREVNHVENGFVILDTAPTGHTLLLLDAAQSYQREVERTAGEVPESVKKLLPRLRDPKQTHVVLVTLAEATPVYETTRLQEDLRRAGIEPACWVINQSWQGIGTTHPILQGRAKSEVTWIAQIKDSLAKQYSVVPWQGEEPAGWDQLKKLTT